VLAKGNLSTSVLIDNASIMMEQTDFLAVPMTGKPLAQWFSNKNKTKCISRFLAKNQG
jgi:hypothetical protein